MVANWAAAYCTMPRNEMGPGLRSIFMHCRRGRPWFARKIFFLSDAADEPGPPPLTPKKFCPKCLDLQKKFKKIRPPRQKFPTWNFRFFNPPSENFLPNTPICKKNEYFECFFKKNSTPKAIISGFKKFYCKLGKREERGFIGMSK